MVYAWPERAWPDHGPVFAVDSRGQVFAAAAGDRFVGALGQPPAEALQQDLGWREL